MILMQVPCRCCTVTRADSSYFWDFTEHYDRLSVPARYVNGCIQAQKINTISGMNIRWFYVSASEVGYFTAILLRKERVQLLQSNIVKYPTTEMGRNLLVANVGPIFASRWIVIVLICLMPLTILIMIKVIM